MADPYQQLVNKIRQFGKENFLVSIAYKLWFQFKNKAMQFDVGRHMQKVVLPRIAFLAAAVAGDRRALRATDKDFLDLTEQGFDLLLLHNETSTSFVSELKKLDLASDDFDKKYNPKLLFFLSIVEGQNESFAFYGNIHYFLYRSFAIAEQLDREEVSVGLASEEKKQLSLIKTLEANLTYLFTYIMQNNGIIMTSVFPSIGDKMRSIGVEKEIVENLLNEFSLDRHEFKEKYSAIINENEWNLRFKQPNLLRDKPLIRLSKTRYVAPSPEHLIMKISGLIISRIYNVRDQEGALVLGDHYGKAIERYLSDVFFHHYKDRFEFLDVNKIEGYLKNQKKADFVVYGKEHVLIVEVKAKVGSAGAKTLVHSVQAAKSVKRITNDKGYAQCEATWRYMKENGMDRQLNPIFIVLVNDDILTFAKLFYNLYHHGCLKLSGDKSPLEVMSLHDFERLMLGFNDVDHLAGEILAHQNSLEPGNSIPFAEKEKDVVADFEHLKRFDRLTPELKDQVEQFGDEDVKVVSPFG